MKRCLAILLALVSFWAAADVADVDVTEISRDVSIVGLDKIPGIALVAYIDLKDPSLSPPYHAFLVKDGENLDDPDGLPILILSLERAALNEAGGLSALDLPEMLAKGKVPSQRILAPFTTYVPDSLVEAYREAITYRVSCVVGSRAFLDVYGVQVDYTNGRSDKKDWSEGAQVQRMDDVIEAAWVESSSFLAEKSYPERYKAFHAFDGDPGTAWSEGAKGPGIGEWIEVSFKRPLKADTIVIMPGWFQAAFFKKNNRVKSLAISLDGKESVFKLKDEMLPQKISIDPKLGVRTIRFTVKEVYKTDKWDDTPIAEIQFLLGGKRIKVDYSSAVEPSSLLQPHYEESIYW
jgi:hypothetical protein